MSLSVDDVVLESNIVVLGRERPLLHKAWLEMQNMYASLADARFPDVDTFVENCELFGVIVVTDDYFERKGALEKWDAEQGQNKAETTDPSAGEPAELEDGFTAIPRVQQAGVAYLKSVEAGEATVGVYITDAWQAETFDVQIIKLLLRWAFEELGFHRIQTALLEGKHKVPLMKLFSHVGFSHEGTRRKAQVGPDAIYKDVTYMGMVDLDWRVWGVHNHTPRTLWDRLFDRQQREREEILVDDGDDEDRFLGKKASTETLRANISEYARSVKSTTASSITDGSGSNAIASGSGLSGSDWDKVDLPPSLAGSDSVSVESEFERLLRQEGATEPPQSEHDSTSIQGSEEMSFIERDADWEDFGERVTYP